MPLWHRAIRPFERKAVKRIEPVVAYTTDPASESLFVPRQKPADSGAKPRYSIRSSPPPGLVRVSKMQRLSGCLPGMGPLYADVSHGTVEFAGVEGFESSVEVRSRADAPDDRQAQQMLSEVGIECHKGGHLRLLNASQRKDAHCLSEFLVTCPRERAVTVRGVYSAVRLSDLTGGADIETSHARITVLNVGPAVTARVAEGIIDYSGQMGSVKLYAGWEINLNLAGPVFEGILEATCEGPVRVLLPPDFATSFEASVAKEATFVCRADIAAQVLRREDGKRVIYTFGAGEPAMRLVSVRGPIVIDNAAGPCDEAAVNAMLRPRAPTLRAQASPNPNLLI